MNNKTFHYKSVLTPNYYWWSIGKISFMMLVFIMLYLLFPSKQEHFGPVPLTLIIIVILIFAIVYSLNKKHVNYLVFNYNEKTIEVNYIKPFKECTFKTNFDKLGFEYYDNGYGFFPRRSIHKVLRIRFNNTLELKISQLEMSFEIETMNEIVEEFRKLNVKQLSKSNLI